MNTSINKSAQCYGLYDKDEIIGFCGVLHFPHPINKKIKSVTRLVILPDYQGIGLGTKFLNFISDIYIQQGFDFKIQTSAKNLISSLIKDKKWILSRYSKCLKVSPSGISKLNKTTSENRITASFFRKNKL